MMEHFPDCLTGDVNGLSCCGLPDSVLIVETSVGLSSGQESVETEFSRSSLGTWPYNKLIRQQFACNIFYINDMWNVDMESQSLPSPHHSSSSPSSPDLVPLSGTPHIATTPPPPQFQFLEKQGEEEAAQKQLEIFV
ncbi:hypothetical protein RRG08_041083 [Elysia crispata]|uniref:Uncharacterized protein n=1 Tax=Elysia crispata TaxID=231223 RepID=A0AAE0Y8M4_9GAST|nr:hypothetical protein RRG08_041083 [Elysia crispata]